MSLVQQTNGAYLFADRKVRVIPGSFKIPTAPHPHNQFVFDSLPIWKEYELLKRARNEGQAHVVAAIDQSQIHVPDEAPKTDVDDYPAVDEGTRRILITMEYAPLGDLRFFMQERSRMFIEDAFFIWLGRQSLLGLQWLQEIHLFHGDVKPPNILAFHGRHTPHIGDLGSFVGLSPLWMDDERHIKHCITTHDYPAPAMLLAGIPSGKNNHVIVGARADIDSWGSS